MTGLPGACLGAAKQFALLGRALATLVPARRRPRSGNAGNDLSRKHDLFRAPMRVISQAFSAATPLDALLPHNHLETNLIRAPLMRTMA
jgi:hypothetical protein